MNGYAQLTIEGQVIGLKFALPAIKQISEKMQSIKLMENATYTDVGIAHILYAGYINNCIIKDVVPQLTFQPFYELVEEASYNKDNLPQIEEAIRVFEASKALEVTLKNVAETSTPEEQPSKKKSLGKKLNNSVTKSVQTL